MFPAVTDRTGHQQMSHFTVPRCTISNKDQLECWSWVSSPITPLVVTDITMVTGMSGFSVLDQNMASLSRPLAGSESPPPRRPRLISASWSMANTCSWSSGFRASICWTIFCGLTALHITDQSLSTFYQGG